METDRLLSRLVVSAMTIFIVLILILAALFIRQIWLQQKLADASVMLQESIEELEETTAELQSELIDIRTTSEQENIVESLDTISSLLEDVDRQLEAVEYSIEDIDLALEQTNENAGDEMTDDDIYIIQDSLDEVFTIFVLLVSGASIIIAVLLGMAVRVKQRLNPK